MNPLHFSVVQLIFWSSVYVMFFVHRRLLENAQERGLKKDTKEINPSTERTENDQVITRENQTSPEILIETS